MLIGIGMFTQPITSFGASFLFSNNNNLSYSLLINRFALNLIGVTLRRAVAPPSDIFLIVLGTKFFLMKDGTFKITHIHTIMHI